MIHNFVKKEKQTNKLKRYIKSILLVVLLFILYVLVGGIVPFIKMKDVSQEYKDSYSAKNYYSDTVGVDRAAIVETSDEAMDARIRMIQAAKERILFSTFSMKTDEASERICAALYDAAERGVKVYMIIDGLSASWDMKKAPMFYALGSNENVTIKYYNMFKVYAPWTFNGRLHDKFIVTDDKMLLLGGRNTSNYFLGTYDQTVLSYDREVFVYNTDEDAKKSVISQVETYFDSLWKSKYSEVYYDKIPKWKREKAKVAKKQFKTVLNEMKSEKPELWVEDFDYIQYTTQVNKITLVTNPIGIYSKQPYIWYTITSLMKDAEESVLIQSPYVVLNERMYKDLMEVEKDIPHCEILLNSMAVGDNICASADYKYSRKKILKTGIDVYEFQGEHSTHNKSFVIDDRLAMIGSFNFDMRSTYLDTESVLLIDGEEFANQLENNIRTMQKESLKVNLDGTYVQGEIEAKRMPNKKKIIFTFLPFVLRPIRFLL